jgi:hypothetical protein
MDGFNSIRQVPIIVLNPFKVKGKLWNTAGPEAGMGHSVMKAGGKD